MLSVLTPGKKKKKVEKERKKQGLPGGPVGQYLPADAGDTGSLPQWVSTCLPMQGTQALFWSGKLPRVAEKLSLGTARSDSEARVPGAPAP